jgi:hypothetical protein
MLARNISISGLHHNTPILYLFVRRWVKKILMFRKISIEQMEHLTDCYNFEECTINEERNLLLGLSKEKRISFLVSKVGSVYTIERNGDLLRVNDFKSVVSHVKTVFPYFRVYKAEL